MKILKHARRLCLILSLTLLMGFPAQAADTGTAWSTANLNVRTGPSTDYEKVGLLRPGDAVSVLSAENGWYQISYGEGTAWICAAYTTDSEPAKAPTSVPGIAENLDGVDTYYVDRVNVWLAYVPENIKAAFVNRGWHVYVTRMNLAATFFPQFNSVQGATLYNEGIIYVEDRESATDSVVHEMGHFLDTQCGTPSLSSEFADIYNAEVGTFKAGIPNPGCVRDPMEMFAETFYWLCVNPARCTPRAAEFVSRYIGAI